MSELHPSDRLGPYEILGEIGVGGMGRVYRARDTRLNRLVAIKVLLADIDLGPEPRRRFEREAQAIASLNHPHICALHDVGVENGTPYLVMEYLEGETLAARLSRGPLPIPQVLRHAVEISDALDQAHRTGVVHRDVKPRNIVLTTGGAKLLDFGLVRNIAPAAAGGSAVLTASTPADLTQQGAVLGTLHYMAPEQVRGEEVDTRTDIFAFGAVLYEMVTGAKAFDATSTAGLMAAILEHEPPPMTGLQPSAPAALERLVRVCLAKEPADRWQNARDVTLQLLDLVAAPLVPAVHASSNRRAWIVPTLALAAVLSAAVFAGLAYDRRASRGETAALEFVVMPPEGSVSRIQLDPFTAVSPDGRHVAFTVQRPGDDGQLWVRSLNALEPRVLTGTDQAFIPFWSPDSEEIGFFTLDGQLKAVSLAGGPVRVLCRVADPLGGTWNQHGVILFSTAGTSVSMQTSVPASGLHRVPARGGVPTPVRISHEHGADSGKQIARRYGARESWPEFLPDGRSFVFLERSSMTIRVGALDSDKTTPLFQADSQALYAQGHLLFVREGTLMGQRFDAERMELGGEPFRIAEDVRFDVLLGGAVFSVSDGVLAYSEGQAAIGATMHSWFDSTGQQTGAVNVPPGLLRLSPDGTRIAQARLAPGSVSDIWITDLTVSGGRSRRLTSGAGAETYPVWSPDGAHLVYASNENGVFDLYRIASSGSGQPEALYRSGHDKIPTDWSADGRFLAFTDRNPKTRSDVLLLDLRQGAAPIAAIATPAAEDQARFSNDGQWLAYRSNESGRSEVYVKPLSDGDSFPVSSDGGTAPIWSHDSRRLFFASLDGRLLAADSAHGGGFRDSAVVPVFALPSVLCGACGIAVTREGRFLISLPSGADKPSERPMRIRTNWLSGLSPQAH